MAPLVFAAFANDDEQSLSLAAEEQALSKAFDEKDVLELKIFRNVNLENLAKNLADPDTRQRTIIFHYAGHADSKALRLEDADAYAKGMAMLLNSQLPNLQLVFLNGCETIEQAEIYIAAGVKSVIATIKPVEDQMAIDFAYFFYKAYYNLNTLNDSFEFAKGFLFSKYNSDNLFFIKSGANYSKAESEDATGQQNIYRLKVLNDEYFRKSLLFKIYYQPPNPQQLGYQPGQKLISTIASSILKGDYSNGTFLQSEDHNTIKNLYDSYIKEKANPRNLFLLSEKILTMLPFPISYHLNNLASLDNTNKMSARVKLLKLQIITYDSSIQLLCFSMLACFWNELVKDRATPLVIKPGQWKVLQNFMASTYVNNTKINYPALIITIREIFEKNELEPFIKEYQNLRSIFNDEEAFVTAHLFIQGLRSSIESNEVQKLDVNWLCFKTEEILSQIFSTSGFIVRYKLSTVKNIEYSRTRTRKAAYRIRRSVLDRSVVIRDDNIICDIPTDTYSVILARGIEKETFTDFINLSPFIIDENALKGEDLSRLFFYSHAEINCYVFRSAVDPEDIRQVKKDDTYLSLEDIGEDALFIINQRMTEVKSELDSFKDLINR